MAYHSLKVDGHFVALSGNEGQVCPIGEGLHSFKAKLMLPKRVDIGVVPESADLITLPPPVINGISGTVGTATMNQNCLHY